MKNKILKSILLVIMIVTILPLLTGCKKNDKPNQDVNKLALEYLEQKYGEKFEYVAARGNSSLGTRQFVASCESFDETVFVQIDKFESEDRVIRDNYMALKYKNELISFVKATGDKYLTNTKVFYDVAEVALSPSDTHLPTFDEYIKDTENAISIVVCVGEKNYIDTEQIKSVAEDISYALGARILNIHVIAVSNEEYIGANDSKLRDDAMYNRCIDYINLSRNNGITSIKMLNE